MSDKRHFGEKGEEQGKTALGLRGCEALVRELFAKSGGVKWGLTARDFSTGLERAVGKRESAGELGVGEREAFLRALHVEDLALAQACACGLERAWEFFVETYRPYLRASAGAILRVNAETGKARELADSLFAELYGLTDGAGERSLFRYFHGRSSLKTWLRAVMAQRHIDAMRVAKRFESLDEPDGDGKTRELAEAAVQPTADPYREKFVKLFQTALAAALEAIAAEDRARLRLYYVEERTLAEIGRKLGEHESSVSRSLDRIRRAMREKTEEFLRRPTPGTALSEEQIALCFEYAAEDVPIDLGKMLRSGSAESVQKGKQTV